MDRVLALSPSGVLTARGAESFGFFSRGKMASTSDTDAHDVRLGRLMAAAQEGDRLAYGQLLRDSESIIRRAARRAGLAGDNVEDALQETLLTLHNARHTYDPARSFTAWLSVIAHRRSIDLLRRLGRSAQREIHAPVAFEQHADPSANASLAWEEAGRAKELKAAIADLSASQREAIEHLALRDRTLAEAAAETGKTVGALKVNFHRALKALREKLGKAQGEDV